MQAPPPTDRSPGSNSGGTIDVPPLQGQLPHHCQSDLSALHRFVQAKLTQQQLAPAVSPDSFRAVLLTGATGFIGRHLLRSLLQRQDNLVVHCIVRSTDQQTGFQRLRSAMEEAGIWDETLAPRIRVISGDIISHRFGLREEEFIELSQHIDAVYHLAASLDLGDSYIAIRKLNTFSMRIVLDLCLHTRMKHLFLASSMGIFPEYFTRFAKEFKDSYISCQMQPDLVTMKRLFPVGIAGYPWSKLVAEQTQLFAQARGLPGAIFRLPLVCSSTNGYFQVSDIGSRLSQAALDVGRKPKGMQLQRNYEPVDMVSDILATISLNPDRQFTLYHCCNLQYPRYSIQLEDFGFDIQETSYEAFKRACQAWGKDSPLYGYWTLVDHFAPYWFHGEKEATPLVSLASEEAIRSDCPDPIDWPGMLISFSRLYDWIIVNRKRWPYKIARARLDESFFIQLAERCSAQADIPVEQALPEWMRNAMGQLLKAFNAPEARLLESRIPLIALDFTRSVHTNVALTRDWLSHPQIAEEYIEKPVFIIGINRSGTTYLHRLMSRDEGFWTLKLYELLTPVLNSGEYAAVACTASDPRRSYPRDVIEFMEKYQMTENQMDGIHDLQLDEPEEDFPILSYSFTSWLFTTRYHLPDYTSWLSKAASHDAYAFHRRLMKHFTWQRRQRAAGHFRTGQWLLKMPFHLMELEALLAAYPDALFIQTHREPAEVMGSWNSFTRAVRSLTSEQMPAHELGAEQLALMSTMLNKATAFRQAHPELSDRWIDVRFRDLVKFPFETLERIYSHFGWTLSPSSRAAMESWQQQQARERKARQPHRYALEDYGLTQQMVDTAFQPYLDFAASIGM